MHMVDLKRMVRQAPRDVQVVFYRDSSVFNLNIPPCKIIMHIVSNDFLYDCEEDEATNTIIFTRRSK